MKGRICKILTSVTIVSLLLTGCGNTNKTVINQSESQEVKKGGVVKQALTESPEGVFMPAFFTFNYDVNVNSMLYDGLLFVNDKFDFEPCLAESYKVSDDKKTITFKIRKGVKWHDGQPFSADDVKFTFDFVCNPKYNGQYTMYVKNIKGYDAYKKGKTNELEGVKKVDEDTIEITTTDIYGSGLLNFGYMMKIIPKHIWEKGDIEAVQKDTNLIRNPIGTGPFKLGKFTPDQSVELVANDNYWGGRPNIDKYIFQVVSAETVDAQLSNKELDIVSAGNLTKEEEENYKKQGFKVDEVTYNVYQSMGLNLKNPLFSEKKVRQAFAYALNREAIVRDVLEGHGEVANNPFPSNFWAHPEGLNEYKYDSQKAIDLLKESGWEYKESDKKMYCNGNPVKFTLKYTSGDDQKTKQALMMQQNFKDIGIELELQPLEFTTMSADVKKGDFDAYLMGMGNSNDADISANYLSTLTPPNGYNYTGFNSKKVDDMLTEGSKHLSKEERKPIYNEVALELNEELPAIYTYHWNSILIYNSNIKNFKNTPIGYYQYIKDWYIDGEQ